MRGRGEFRHLPKRARLALHGALLIRERAGCPQLFGADAARVAAEMARSKSTALRGRADLVGAPIGRPDDGARGSDSLLIVRERHVRPFMRNVQADGGGSHWISTKRGLATIYELGPALGLPSVGVGDHVVGNANRGSAHVPSEINLGRHAKAAHAAAGCPVAAQQLVGRCDEAFWPPGPRAGDGSPATDNEIASLVGLPAFFLYLDELSGRWAVNVPRYIETVGDAVVLPERER